MNEEANSAIAEMHLPRSLHFSAAHADRPA
jgi:hypothetical protein